MSSTPSASFDEIMNACKEQRVTGVLRVRDGLADLEGEIRFLSGIQDSARLGGAVGDEALAHISRLENPEFSAVESLPPMSESSKQDFPVQGSLGDFRPVDLMRYCEDRCLTCTLHVQCADRLVKVQYELGELVNVTPEADLTISVLEATDGEYRFELPAFDLPDLKSPKVPALDAEPAAAAPAPKVAPRKPAPAPAAPRAPAPRAPAPRPAATPRRAAAPRPAAPARSAEPIAAEKVAAPSSAPPARPATPVPASPVAAAAEPVAAPPPATPIPISPAAGAAGGPASVAPPAVAPPSSAPISPRLQAPPRHSEPVSSASPRAHSAPAVAARAGSGASRKYVLFAAIALAVAAAAGIALFSGGSSSPERTGTTVSEEAAAE